MSSTVTSLPTALAPIEPLRPATDGVYRDGWVEVRAELGAPARRSRDMVRTPHFDVVHDGPRVVLSHRLPAHRLDDDLSGLLADELFRPGWLRGAELFERLFTGVVLSSGPDPVACWSTFYANTLQRVGASLAVPPGGHAAHGTIVDYAPVYGFAESLLAPGSVLELGCSFGFLSLRLAAERRVTASDLSPGTIAVLTDVAARLGCDLETRVADAGRVPAPDGFADNVLAIHLLEHLDAPHGERVLREAVRLARRRVVIAVPLEDEADETWGHVRTLDLADLDRWGRSSGVRHAVHDFHGGWLVLDLP